MLAESTQHSATGKSFLFLPFLAFTKGVLCAVHIYPQESMAVGEDRNCSLRTVVGKNSINELAHEC